MLLPRLTVEVLGLAVNVGLMLPRLLHHLAHNVGARARNGIGLALKIDHAVDTDVTAILGEVDRQGLQGLLDAAGVHKPGPKQWVLHEARHTTVSLLEAAGVPPAVIIAIVGHATYASTRRYSHTELERARAALATVADDLGLKALASG